ncbi:MAG: hypothetical protein WAT79_07560, partial [Saprospiraceae bacterium]
MKSRIIILVSILWSVFHFSAGAQSETCDILTNGISSTPSIVAGTGVSTISFDVVNEAGAGSCSYPINSVLVIVTLPASGLDFLAFTSPIVGTYFTWAYDPIENIITGVNHAAVADGQGEIVSVTLEATAVPSNTYPDCRVVVLDIINNPDGPIYPANINENNDGGYTTITITPENGASTVSCVADAIQPIPTFDTKISCTGPNITFVDTPALLDCEGTRVWSFDYTTCAGCPFNSFTWTYTYTIERNVFPSEVGGPVIVYGTENCVADIAPPGLLPSVESLCDEVLSPVGPIQKSQLDIDFSDAVVTGAPAQGVWYTDRYAPF